MNNRNILKAYALLQQMTPDEHALLNLLRSLSETEREQLIEIMGGNEPSSKKKAGKKSDDQNKKRCGYRFELSGALCNRLAKNRAHHDRGQLDYHVFQESKSSSKSSRASGMAAAISGNLQAQREAIKFAPGLCAFRGDNNTEDCGEPASSLIHDPIGGYAGYHPFVSAALPVAHEAEAGG